VPESRFRSDRAVMLAVAALLLAAAAAVLLASRGTEMLAAARPVAIGLTFAAAALALWAMLGVRAEGARRDALDKAVDDEMGRKWAPGFARTVGAFDKPWYVLCGEPGVGKTAALRAGRLPMALGPDGRPVTDAEQGKQGTYLFDWWFFQDAVVLDSAGDLIAAEDDRWTAFLARIRSARPHRPINGMLLAVSAADLIAGDAEQLRAKAALLAKQVRVAREQLRVRFPLYLLVTKADLIPGFADFFPTGSDLKASFQILGWSDDRDPRRDDTLVTPVDVRRGLDALVADLRRRRAAVESHTTTGRPDAQRRLEHLDEMFAFPAAAAAALDNLGPFIAALLEQVTSMDDALGPVSPPFFRGVYLTSALRTGEALDAELARAFGTELRPTARRAASDRAFFIRDLLLEKVVPEAGMVAPLTAVPLAAGRRSRLIAAAAAAAAVVVVGGTALGYRRTVARARADRDFWDGLAAVPADQLPATLALFDPRGGYRGQTEFDGRTVLATYERSADLARTDTASPLLPASAQLNRDRVAAHADLFRQLALAPALVPGPYAPPAPGGPSPVAATSAVLRVLLDTRGTAPVPLATLRADAAALVPLRADAVDRTRLLALLAADVPAVTATGEPASAVTLTDLQRRRIADGAVAWVGADLNDRRRGAVEVVTRAVDTARDAVALADALATFQRAVLPASAPEELVEPARTFDRAVATHPGAADGAAVDRTTVTRALQAPPELDAIGPALAKLSDPDARGRLATMVLQYNDFLDAQRSAVAAGMNGHAPGGDATTTTPREHLRAVDGGGTPLVVARCRWFRGSTKAALDAVATATSRPVGPGTPPAVALPPMVAQTAADDAARRHSFDALADADAPAERDADRATAAHLFDLTNRAANDAVWVEVQPRGGQPLWPADAAPSTDTLVLWLASQLATEAAVHDRPPSRGADEARQWVAASHDQLERVARTWLDGWKGDADREVGPPVRTWADVGQLVSAGPAAQMTKQLWDRTQVDRDGVAELARQDLFPAVRRAAAEWTEANDAALSPEAAARYESRRTFLATYGFGRDPVDVVRAKLVTDPAAMDTLTHLAAETPRSPVEAYWHDAMVSAVGLLSDAARQHSLAVLRDLRADVANRYPLTADGTAAWDGVVDDKLSAGLALADAAAGSTDAMVRQVQGLDVVTPQWQRYLSTLRDVVAFARQKPVAWTVTFGPAGSAGDDAWAAVAAWPTTAGGPARFHAFSQHRGVPVDWTAIVGGLSVRLSHEPPDRPAPRGEPVLPDLARPWALYRLAVAGGAATDDTARVAVRLDRHGDPAVPVAPAVVP
jgi:hypothetical protein